MSADVPFMPIYGRHFEPGPGELPILLSERRVRLDHEPACLIRTNRTAALAVRQPAPLEWQIYTRLTALFLVQLIAVTGLVSFAISGAEGKVLRFVGDRTAQTYLSVANPPPLILIVETASDIRRLWNSAHEREACDETALNLLPWEDSCSSNRSITAPIVQRQSLLKVCLGSFTDSFHFFLKLRKRANYTEHRIHTKSGRLPEVPNPEIPANYKIPLLARHDIGGWLNDANPRLLLLYEGIAGISPLAISYYGIADGKRYGDDFENTSRTFESHIPPLRGLMAGIGGLCGIAWGWWSINFGRQRNVLRGIVAFVFGILSWMYACFILLPWSIS
jgi:hypothetical protein